jgi:ubiquinone/menaquinone biosynthesis C-methylase UbiE
MTNDPSSATPAEHSDSKAAGYALVSTDHERQRLMRQGAILREHLADAFRAAGLAPGMRVLDIGCGVGDVSMLAAELVGPAGSVVGLDRDPDNVAWATRRIADAGFANIRFQAAEFHDFTDSQPFDALVGRFILLYLPDPVATLRRLSQQLRSGAVIAFLEPDFDVPSRLFPDVPLFKNSEHWVTEALRRSGARVDMGMRLYATYRDAGFVNTATMVSHLSGCGFRRETLEYFSETVRSILPRIEQFGIATRKEVDIDTLADRLEAAVRTLDLQWVTTRYISAWAKKP